MNGLDGIETFRSAARQAEARARAANAKPALVAHAEWAAGRIDLSRERAAIWAVAALRADTVDEDTLDAIGLPAETTQHGRDAGRPRRGQVGDDRTAGQRQPWTR